MAGKPVKAPNPRRIARFQLYDIMNYYPVPISRSQAIKIMKVSESTWRRYMAGTANPHPAAVELLKLHALGRIMPESFEGCYFQQDKLIDDYGNVHTRGDLRLHQLYARNFHKFMALQKSHDFIPKPRAINGERLDNSLLRKP